MWKYSRLYGPIINTDPQLEKMVMVQWCSKVIPVNTQRKEQRRSSTIFNLSAKWSQVVNFKHRRSISQNRIRYPLNKRLCGLQSQSGRSRERKNLSFLPEFKPQRPAPSQVLIPTDPSRPQCCNCHERNCFVNVNSNEMPVHVLRVKVRWYIY
jgi:hypothetical protein